MTPFQKKSANHLITAYNQMMEEMRNAFEQADPGELSMQQALNLAKQRIVNLGEVSAEEAYQIGEYIKRDINDAAEYMMECSAEFYDWLMLDIEIIERKVMDLFLTVADHTRIELEQFEHKKHQFADSPSEAIGSEFVPVYKSGEITGPGTLICENCGQIKTFPSSDEINDCEGCGHYRFIRRQQENK